MNSLCPCCLSAVSGNSLYSHKKIPALNNVAYNSYIQALTSKTGIISLFACSECGLVFNSAYDEKIISYDRTYDNDRSHSACYIDYLNSICEECMPLLSSKSSVLEIGCGNGDFLKKLSDRTECRAFGYDSAYSGDKSYREKVFFKRKHYRPEQNSKKYDMLILRHVLEHIPAPLSLLTEICRTDHIKKGAGLLLEVPNLEWIISKKAFFDITYEHCNYFTAYSLTRLASGAGFKTDRITEVFSGQYLLLFGTFTGKKENFAPPSETVNKLLQLHSGFHMGREILLNNIIEGEKVCVWGASGKGVIFLSNLSEDVLKKVTYVVDINPLKQGMYLPVSGKKVDSPAELKYAGDGLLVIVMNGVYENEIRTELNKMGIKASVITADSLL